MSNLPDYMGVSAFGIKMGVIVPGSDIVSMVCSALKRCNADGFVHDGDIVCVTESVVARAQNNYVTVQDISNEIRDKLNLKADSSIGVLFPILSRNRFSLIMKGIAAAVPEGRVVVQLSHPADEVGNQILPLDFAEEKGISNGDIIRVTDINERFLHPITGVDYIALYHEIITAQAQKAEVFLCNDPCRIRDFEVDGVVVANIHSRERTRRKLEACGCNTITLQDICNQGSAWSEWGLLGSNLSSGDKLKLAPRQADEIAMQVKERVSKELRRDVEVIIYGDGAYRDPSTGIYELADPQPAFGITPGISGRYREGLKYKYLVDKMLDEGADLPSIASCLEVKKGEKLDRNSVEAEGTTPRRVEDLVASLADLVSGSADAGTPVIVVKGFFNN